MQPSYRILLTATVAALALPRAADAAALSSADSIDDAVANGARVISLAMDGVDPDAADLVGALQRAASAGVVIVAAGEQAQRYFPAPGVAIAADARGATCVPVPASPPAARRLAAALALLLQACPSLTGREAVDMLLTPGADGQLPGPPPLVRGAFAEALSHTRGLVSVSYSPGLGRFVVDADDRTTPVSPLPDQDFGDWRYALGDGWSVKPAPRAAPAQDQQIVPAFHGGLSDGHRASGRLVSVADTWSTVWRVGLTGPCRRFAFACAVGPAALSQPLRFDPDRFAVPALGEPPTETEDADLGRLGLVRLVARTDGEGVVGPGAEFELTAIWRLA